MDKHKNDSNGVALTSRIAYLQIHAEGVTSNQKEIIYQAVVNYCEIYEDGISNRELSKRTGIELNSVCGRVNELKDDNLLKTIDKRHCKISKRLVSPVVLKTEDDQEEINPNQFNLFGGVL